MTDSPPAPDFDFLAPAMQRLAEPCTLREFTEWYASWLAAALPAPQDSADARDPRSMGLIMARTIWQRTPDPAAGWRLRSLPQPARNDPCYCGSGRKFKQCCQPLLASVPALDLDPVGLGGLLAAVGPASLRDPASLRRMPPLMLAAAAHAWKETHGAAGVVDLLEPVFLQPRGLDAHHDAAFDELMDAMLDEGLDARRERLARTVAAEASERRLRGTARCRLASILCDRGQYDAAWTELRAAQREDADAPEQLHLELVLLLAQRRLAEAKARTPLLAARARKLGYPELAQALVRIEQAGPDALHHGFREEEDGQEVAWAELLRFAIGQMRGDTFGQLHEISKEEGPDGVELVITPKKQVLRRLAAWSRRFGAAAPGLTSLQADADELLDEPQAALAWLQERPELCCAVPVLDDLIIAARAMREESAAPAVRKPAADLAYAAAGLVVDACAAWPQARLSWLVTDNRPALRIVAQAISLALFDEQLERAEGWMRWMLARNPTDNHGWREVLRVQLLRKGDAGGALEWLDAYPDDAPPSGHDRALALFMLGRRAEAEQALREAHAAWPAFVKALLPQAVDRPAGGQDGYVVVGGADQAWYWRSEIRPAWESSGALEWLRSLALPEGKAARARKPPRAPSRRTRRAAPAVELRSAPARDPIPALRNHFGDRLPWVLGWLASSAWSPEPVMPTVWLGALLEAGGTLEDAGGLAALLAAVMDQYNAMNALVLGGRLASDAPLPDAAIPRDDDAAWIAFTAGFVQFAESHAKAAWRAAGLVLDPRKGAFAPLYQLAAQAPAGPGGWTPGDPQGRPLLGLAENTAAARELLERALQPLWRAAVAAR